MFSFNWLKIRNCLSEWYYYNCFIETAFSLVCCYEWKCVSSIGKVVFASWIHMNFEVMLWWAWRTHGTFNPYLTKSLTVFQILLNLVLVDSGLSQSSVFGALCLNRQAHTHRYTFVHSAMSQQPFSADECLFFFLLNGRLMWVWVCVSSWISDSNWCTHEENLRFLL